MKRSFRIFENFKHSFLHVTVTIPIKLDLKSCGSDSHVMKIEWHLLRSSGINVLICSKPWTNICPTYLINPLIWVNLHLGICTHLLHIENERNLILLALYLAPLMVPYWGVLWKAPQSSLILKLFMFIRCCFIRCFRGVSEVFRGYS